MISHFPPFRNLLLTFPKTSEKIAIGGRCRNIFLAVQMELEPVFWSTSCWKFEQQICVVRRFITVILKCCVNLQLKSCVMLTRGRKAESAKHEVGVSSPLGVPIVMI